MVAVWLVLLPLTICPEPSFTCPVIVPKLVTVPAATLTAFGSMILPEAWFVTLPPPSRSISPLIVPKFVTMPAP